MSNVVSNYITAIARGLVASREQTSWAWIDRQHAYAAWDAYYDNSIYESFTNGGQRDQINSALGNASAADLAGLYNPVAAVVDLYLHVFAGAFGDEIKALPLDRAGAPTIAAIEQIWRWSNMTIVKQPLCRMAANHGSVGLRIVARNDPDPARRRVYIKPEHPRIIRDIEEDDRGNVIAAQLEYDETTGLGEGAKTTTIREEMDKQEFRFYEVKNGQATLTARFPNALGVVPYVLLRHDFGGDRWGRNAYAHARVPIDRLNAQIAHLDIQIHDHLRATWIVAAPGDPPTEFNLADRRLIYFNTRNSTSNPFVQAMIANLDLSGALAQSQFQLGLIEDMLPELKATQGRFLANQSGETVAELRKPAENKLSLARANYEDAVIRAQEIALSWGILLGMWDLGTGMGARAAAERAYREGFESHRFNVRPLLDGPAPAGTSAPQSPADAFSDGDRVAVVGEPHADGQGAGTVRLVNDGPAYGIVFDGMEGMGVHKWYVGEELLPADDPAPPARQARPQAQKTQMDM